MEATGSVIGLTMHQLEALGIGGRTCRKWGMAMMPPRGGTIKYILTVHHEESSIVSSLCQPGVTQVNHNHDMSSKSRCQALISRSLASPSLSITPTTTLNSTSFNLQLRLKVIHTTRQCQCQCMLLRQATITHGSILHIGRCTTPPITLTTRHLYLRYSIFPPIPKHQISSRLKWRSKSVL